MSSGTLTHRDDDSQQGSTSNVAAAQLVDSVTRWRAWVTEHRIGAAVLAGLVATHVATIIGYWMPSIGLPQLDWNRVNGMIYTPGSSSNVQFLAGGIYHYADGVVFAVMYAIALHPLLRWRSSTRGNLLKGLFFGTVLATISCAFMTPRVYYRNVDVGFFSHHLGWKLIFAVYLWHWVYGAHLGTIYNPRDERESS